MLHQLADSAIQNQPTIRSKYLKYLGSLEWFPLSFTLNSERVEAIEAALWPLYQSQRGSAVSRAALGGLPNTATRDSGVLRPLIHEFCLEYWELSMI